MQKQRPMLVTYFMTAIPPTVRPGGNRSAGVLTIYLGKPKIPVGKSNGSRHSVWETSENMGYVLR